MQTKMELSLDDGIDWFTKDGRAMVCSEWAQHFGFPEDGSAEATISNVPFWGCDLLVSWADWEGIKVEGVTEGIIVDNLEIHREFDILLRTLGPGPYYAGVWELEEVEEEEE